MRVIWKRKVCVGTVYLTLHGVEGIGTSGQRYPGLGAAQVQYPPGPGIANFALQGVGHLPHPFFPAEPHTPEDQALAVSITLTFDDTGALTEVSAEVGEPIAQ